MQCDSAVSVHLSPPSRAFHTGPIPRLLGHLRAARWAPCVTRRFPTSYLFNIWLCICFRAILSTWPPFSAPGCVHKSFLYICVSIPAMQIGWSVPFPRSHVNVTCNICFFLPDLLHSVWQIFRFIRLASQVAPVVKNLPAEAGDTRNLSSIPGSGRPPGGGHGNPLQCSCLENPMDRQAWRATVHRVTKSRTQLRWLSIWTNTAKVECSH